MLQSLIFASLLVSGVGMPLVLTCEDNVIQEKVEFKEDNIRYASYNDNDYSITLSSYELNNYSFINLSLLVNEEITTGLEEFTMSYNSISLSYSEFVYEDYFYFLDASEEYDITFNLNSLHKFFLTIGEDVSPFEYDLVWNLNGTYYTSIKSAIELDIQANTQPREMGVLTEFVSLLVGGIVPFVSGLGSGVSSLVNDIFISNNSLSVFGVIICVFGGIALAVGLSRWVMNFLTSLGAKK